MKCAECGTPMTGYIMKKKNVYYYKCNKIGCRCNRSTKQMNQMFAQFLKAYQIDSNFVVSIKDQLLYTNRSLTDPDKETVRALKQSLSELESKLGFLQTLTAS